MKTINLHLESMETKEELHAFIRRELEAEKYYGDNLDALYDILVSVPRPVKIVVFSKFTANMPLGDYAGKIVTVLQDAADENMALRLSLLE